MVWAATALNGVNGVMNAVDTQQKEKKAENTAPSQGGQKSQGQGNAQMGRAVGNTAASIGIKFLE